MTIDSSEKQRPEKKKMTCYVLKERSHQPRSLNPKKILFKNEGETKTFSDKRKFS
jgi:hypothetical protein